MSGLHVKLEVATEDFLAHLTDAAYRVALKNGLAVPFIDVELEMHQALRQVIHDKLRVSEESGN